MARNTEVIVLVDSHGRLLGAQLAGEAAMEKSKNDPTANLVPIRGQRALSINVPSAILRLAGPDLHRFFSEVHVRSDGELKLPKVRVVKGHMK